LRSREIAKNNLLRRLVVLALLITVASAFAAESSQTVEPELRHFLFIGEPKNVS